MESAQTAPAGVVHLTEPARAQGEAHRALTRGGVALISNSALTSILGVVYWLAAAHLMSRADLGRGSSLLSALWTVSALSQLNYARALPGLLPRAGGGAGRLLAVAYTRVVVVGVVLGLAFAIGAPVLNSKLSYFTEIPAFAVIFSLSVPVYSIFNLEDAVLATVRRAMIIPFENSTFGVLKLVLLFGLTYGGTGSPSMVIVASWILPLILIIVPINVYLFRRAVPQAAQTFPPAATGPRQGGARWVRYDLIGYLFWLLGTLPLPVLAVSVLGPVQTAAFTVPFTIATAIDVLTLNLGNTLTAEMTRAQGRFSTPTTQFVWRVWAIIAVACVGLIATAPYVLDLFGAQYRQAGTTVFQVLMLASLPRSVMFFSIAAARARAGSGRGRARGPLILVLQGTTSVSTLAISLLAMHSLGILGMAVGWSAGSALGAAIALAAERPPSLRTALREETRTLRAGRSG